MYQSSFEYTELYTANLYILHLPLLYYEQGTVCVGARSSSHVVLAALRRAPSELASHQNKLFKVDEHLGMAMAGLTADGRSLLK
jgi:20S proteasome subunit alpha 6